MRKVSLIELHELYGYSLGSYELSEDNGVVIAYCDDGRRYEIILDEEEDEEA